jgi:hypothetical protein
MRLAIVHTPPGTNAGNDTRAHARQETLLNPWRTERNVPLGRVTGLPGEGTSGGPGVFNAGDEKSLGRIFGWNSVFWILVASLPIALEGERAQY